MTNDCRNGQPTSAVCPRCGYDQRGAIAQWNESCPLESICTECGLAIDWSELLSPARQPPRWCVEYAIGLKRTLIALPVTLGMVFLPWVFWKRMRIEHPIRWRRVALFIAVLAAAMYLLFAHVQAHSAYHSNYFTFYTVITPGTAPPTVADREAEYWHTLLLPVSRYPKTIYGQAPIRIFIEDWFDRGRLLTVTAAVTLTFPLVFILLPFSRRRAKVRWGHVLRIAVYAAPLWILQLAATFIAVLLGYQIMGWSQEEGGLAAMTMYYALALPALLLVFWAMAIRYYLRMPHAWAIAASMAVIGVIIGLLGIFFLGLHHGMLRWMFV